MWLKIKIWTKGILFGLVALYALVFFLKNEEKVNVWYLPFKPKYEIPLIYLALLAVLAGVVGTILVRTTFTTIRQIRDLRSRNRLERLEREHADMKAKAAMLQTRSSLSGAANPDQFPPRAEL